MNKHPDVPAFGALSGTLPNVSVRRSPLGSIVAKNLYAIPSLCPRLRILQYVIMPDHIHFLIQVTDTLDLHLGYYLGMFKVKTCQEYERMSGIKMPVFEEDYYDCFLYPSRSLDTIYRYIRDNPRRLAVRRAHPEYFRRVNNLKIGNAEYRAYGNFQLLECPFKEQVVVHRADSPEIRKRNHDRWIYGYPELTDLR